MLMVAAPHHAPLASAGRRGQAGVPLPSPGPWSSTAPVTSVTGRRPRQPAIPAVLQPPPQLTPLRSITSRKHPAALLRSVRPPTVAAKEVRSDQPARRAKTAQTPPNPGPTEIHRSSETPYSSRTRSYRCYSPKKSPVVGSDPRFSEEKVRLFNEHHRLMRRSHTHDVLKTKCHLDHYALISSCRFIAQSTAWT